MTIGRFRSLLAAPLALVVALTLGACGGSGSSAAKQSVGTLLAATFGPHSPAHSGQLAVSVDLNLQGLKSLTGPLTFKLNGPFQGHGPKALPDFKLSVLAGQAGNNFSAGLIVLAGKGYVQFAGNSYSLPDTAIAQFRTSYLQSQANATKQHSGTFAAFGIDPRQWLSGATKAGTEQMGGTQTEHITAGIDVTKFLTDVNKLLGKAGQLGVTSVASAPTSIPPAAIAALTTGVKSARVDVWTGSSDRVLRRLKIAVVLDVPPGNRTAVGGLSSGTINLDLQLSALNKAQTITAPTNVQPLASLSGQAGSPGAGAGAGGTGTGTTGSGSVSAPPAYLNCVQRAAGDVAKIQTCSSLLGR